MYELKKDITEFCKKLILITGSARSGTSIFGKIIASMKDVEYSYEPPFLFSLFPEIDSMKGSQWCHLFNTYIFEDFLIETLAGRRINLNKLQESSIYNLKEESDIEKRISSNFAKPVLERQAFNSIPLIKMPDINPYIKKFYKTTKLNMILVSVRNFEDSLLSLHKKKWFSENLDFWPYKKNSNSELIPHFVSEEFTNNWKDFNDLEKCAVYFICMYENILDQKNINFLNYDKLIRDPNGYIDFISQVCHLEPSKKTKEILKTVRRRDYKQKELEFSSISPQLINRLVNINEEIESI